ncbi:MAG: DNA polymerase III subunit delta [Spirochaetales bacterium]|nr:DNA polymerase III subunit delta [Spirochaetales bacterium]
MDKIHLLLGPEEGQKKAHIKSLRDKLVQSLGEEPEDYRFYPDEKDLSEIISLISNGSLFAPHRFVQLYNVEAYKGNQQKALIEYIKKPAEDATLVLVSEKNSVDKKLDSVVPKAGKKVFWELFERDKKSWVFQYFRERKMLIEPEAVDDLLEMVENNTEEMKKACSLLFFYFKEGAEITTDDIDRILYHSKEETVFTLFDKIALRDLEGALDIYAKIRLAAGGDMVQLLGGLLWQIKKLLEVALLLEGGMNPQQAFTQLKVFGKKRQALFLSGTRSYSAGELQRAVALIAEYDGKARSSRKEMQGPMMDLFLYQLMR